MTYRKKLIEVALPLEAISEAAATEKNIHTGQLANLHTWWSRKPLTAARAVLFASLVDDPGNDLPETDAEKERLRLFRLIEKLISWDNNNDPEVLREARAEIAKSLHGKRLSFLDPFCGGGSIPLEAQRLGLDVYASDLNPVAVLMTRLMIEIVPRYLNRPPVNPSITRMASLDSTWSGTTGLKEDIEYYSKWINDQAQIRIGHLYPQARTAGKTRGSETQVIAWLWARSVECPNPACRAHTPLVNKFWVSTHKGNEAWVKPIIDKRAKTVRFDIVLGEGTPPAGTVTKRGAKCLVCNSNIPLDHIRSQGVLGKIEYRLMSIVAEGQKSRIYLPPQDSHVDVAHKSTPGWSPDTDLPTEALGFRVQRYGMSKHSDLFTPRQLMMLTTFSELINEAREKVLADSRDDAEYANAICTFLGLGLSRLAQTNNTLVRWLVRKSGTSKGTPAFDRQIVSMVWEFSEGNVFAGSVGSWSAAIKNTLTALAVLPTDGAPGIVLQADAAREFIAQQPPLVSTDPPYFDNIGYADLSDFYYVWLRHTLGKIYPDIFGTLLVPKRQEIIAAPHMFDGDKLAAENHFLEGLQMAFGLIRENANPLYPVSVYYAFKQSEESNEEDEEENAVGVSSTGWETMLEALLRAGFSVTGTWPMRTEQAARMRAIGANALASSVVLVCRPRPENAPLATRRELIAGLKKELPSALRKLQHGNIAPVDLAQATIGPGMAIFSRYAKVLEADGNAMSVRSALQIINQELDAYLAAQEGEMDKDTRFCLSWFDQRGMDEGPFGEADVLARAKNTAVQGLVDAGVVHSRAGKVRLLKREEYSGDWDPIKDRRLTVWECAQYLIKALNDGGEEAAARLVNRLGGGRSEDARALAYRLYSICERKKWADEALAYNMLVVSWPAIQDKAAQIASQPIEQGKLFE